MKRNERGFTLVELLAVIVILGLLMAIAIPSVTKYITQSRIKTLVTTMDSYVTAVVTQVNNGEYKFSDSTKIFAIPIECISLEKGGTDPFGNWYQANSSYWAYVLVHYDNETYNYQYGFTFKDDAGYGLYPTLNSKITNNMVRTGYDDLKQPRDGLALNFVTIDKWEGFSNITTSTQLEVLVAESEGVEGDGQFTCTLCQKGDNYDAVEEEKNKSAIEKITCNSIDNCSWDDIKIIAEAGKGEDYFKIGDSKSFTTTDGKIIVMEIAEFNVDEKSNGTGRAGITWISKYIIDTRVMNSTRTNVGGWKDSEMREWLQNDFYNTLPSNIKGMIKYVDKSYHDKGTSSTLIVSDNIWIPSCHEVTNVGYAGIKYETSGATYHEYFKNYGAKTNYDGVASIYWSRSAYGFNIDGYFQYITKSGTCSSSYSDAANKSYGVVFGFCI